MATGSTIHGLNALEARLKEDLTFLQLPSRSWVPAQEFNGQRVRDVVVIGAGMCGLVAMASLMFAGVDNIVAYDTADEGQEGPWVTFARMRTLRSPKVLAGPALGISSLTFRAWFTAQFGADEWERLDKIPKDMWMDYLIWYRRVLSLPVRNNVFMKEISADRDDMVTLHLENADGEFVEYARHLVLATGRSGLGGSDVPPFLDNVDRRFWAHSADDIDFAALAGKRVAVIGAGASAMDNAATALEHGAASLDMLIRRKEMPRVNKMTGIGSKGVVNGIRYLPDDWKWKFFAYVADRQTPPPSSSTRRVSRHENARFFLDCAVEKVREEKDHLVVECSIGSFEADFLIAGTGFRNDFHGRSEFAAIAPHIRTWADGVYRPEMGPPVPCLMESPFLGEAYEFLEKDPGYCPMLSRIHCFNDAATLSHGKLSGDIPAVSDGAQRLMRGIVADLFVADRAAQFAALQAFDEPELEGDEWVDSTPLITAAAE